MNRGYIKYLIVFLTALPLGATAETVYVQSKAAKIYSDKSFKSTTLMDVERGAELELLTRQGSWIEVRSGKVKGWVPSLLVSDQKPVAKDSVLVDKSKDIKETARRRASSTSVAGAARGLQGEEDSSEADNADYKALDEVESIKHTEDEIRTFIDEGKKRGE